MTNGEIAQLFFMAAMLTGAVAFICYKIDESRYEIVKAIRRDMEEDDANAGK